MSVPSEGLPFPIDLSLNARFVPNDVAVRLARRRIQDADQIMHAESDGDQGVSDAGFERTQQARDLLSHLQKASKPAAVTRHPCNCGVCSKRERA